MPWAYCQIRNITGCACAARFSPPSRFSDPDMHQGTCVTHVPWCMPGSLKSGFLWNRWRGKCSRHMHNPLFNVSGKRAIERKTGIYCFHKTLNNIGTIQWYGTVDKRYMSTLERFRTYTCMITCKITSLKSLNVLYFQRLIHHEELFISCKGYLPSISYFNQDKIIQYETHTHFIADKFPCHWRSVTT